MKLKRQRYVDETKAAFMAEYLNDQVRAATVAECLLQLERGILPVDRDFLQRTMPTDQLTVAYIKDHGTVCRACLQRNTADTPVVTIASNLNGPRLETSLCLQCYERAQLTLSNDSFGSEFRLPRLNSLKMQERYAEGTIYCEAKPTVRRAAEDLKRAVKLLGRSESSLRSL